MEGQSPPPKWEGEVSAETTAGKPHEIWPLLADDFCSLHKWLPIDTCHYVEGVPGQPGLIRYCASTDMISSPEPSIKWAHERLTQIDPTKYTLTYEIRENNIGFKSYVATMKLLPDGGGDGGGGCKIVWSFVADPIEGWPLEEFVKYLDFSLHHMVNKMAEYLQKSP
ncbi:lachrymatory-factor synthase-like [Benincasa hispida]|uniref:lachrymatory-factor synthase-like n=1 Tax=Benincasa hispida TaxID=102211 RepID=UPI0018FF1B61|nr:lachrymatory-factor synthase-like [Benincasa hispida]